MSTTVVDDNNKLIKFDRDLHKEFVNENMFTPYMGTALTSIIRVGEKLVGGGEEVNLPLVTKFKGRGRGVGTLVGHEEAIDNYGMRLYMDWARHGTKIKKDQQHKSSIDLRSQSKPMLSNWGKERQRNDIIEAMMALPLEGAPAGFGSDEGETVNGIKYELASPAQRNTWNVANSDRVLYGNAVGNYHATHATALNAIDATNDRFVKATIGLLKRRAKNASPAIHPFMTKDGYSHFVCFAGTNSFRDLSASLEQNNLLGRAREGRGMENNPVFQDGDLLHDGVIIREVPEISDYVSEVWTSLLTAGNGSSRVEPVFLCGQQAVALEWGQRAAFRDRKEDDYGFIHGIAVEMAYGIGKMFKKHPMDGTALKQWGVVTGFVSAPQDA